MIIIASRKQIPVTPKKMRMVVESVKNLSPLVAIEQLEYQNKNAALPLSKLLKQAVANAQNNYQLSPDSLRIKEIMVDKGWTLKRWRAASRGRGKPFTRVRSHVTVKLISVTPEVAKPKAAPKTASKTSPKVALKKATPAKTKKTTTNQSKTK